MTRNKPTWVKKTDSPKVGRPLKYKPEELQAELDKYFNDKSNIPYSIMEICAVLDITRETWNEWEYNPNKGLSHMVKRAKARVAAGWEKGHVAPNLAIFLMKNHLKYTDKHEQEVTGKDGNPIEFSFKWKDDEPSN